MTIPKKHRRSGITLFEVVIALVIFTLTLPALNALVRIGAQRAEDSAFLARASMECRSKLAEVTVGAEPISSTDWVGLPDANWFWKMNAVDGDVDGLKQIQVSVKYDPGSNPVQVTLSQIIIDPASRGSTQDRGLLANSAKTSDPASSSNSSGGSDSGNANNSGAAATSSSQTGTGTSANKGTGASGGGRTGTGGSSTGTSGKAGSGGSAMGSSGAGAMGSSGMGSLGGTGATGSGITGSSGAATGSSVGSAGGLPTAGTSGSSGRGAGASGKGGS